MGSQYGAVDDCGCDACLKCLNRETAFQLERLQKKLHKAEWLHKAEGVLRFATQEQAESLREGAKRLKTTIERLRRWEAIVVDEVARSLRHLGENNLAGRFVESISPIQQRIGMVIHCLQIRIEAAEAAGVERD